MVAGRSDGLRDTRGNAMNLPKIDLGSLPDLDVLTGVFGSLAKPAQALVTDDTIVVIMTFIYEITNP